MGKCLSRVRRRKEDRKSLDSKVVRNENPERSQAQEYPSSSTDFRPSWRRKDDVIPDLSVLQIVDQHAIQAPASAHSSVVVLAHYLSHPFQSDLQKIRAFYRWITEHISYATDQFFSNKIESCDADAVLTRGSAVCQGYAELFLALCKEVQIPCCLITGFAKDFTYNPQVPFTLQTETNHAWNLVCLEGVWRHVECTWGSGYLNGSTFVKSYEEVYFLTDAEDFIQAHFPYMDDDLVASAKYQLLRRPIDLETFNRLVKIFGTGLEYGLRTLTHRNWHISVSQEVVVKIKAERQKLEGLMADLLENDVEVFGHVLVRRESNDTYSVRVRPPALGTYELCLLGRDRRVPSLYYSMINYVITCKEVMKNLHPYPKERRTQYGPSLCALEYGLAEEARAMDVLISKDGTLDFMLTLTRNMPAIFNLTYAEGDLPDLDRHVMGTYVDGALHVRAQLPRAGFYELTVFGKPPGKDTHRYDTVLTLLVECQRGKSDSQPFPTSFGASAEMACTLVEPLTFRLPANQKVKVKVTSPLLKRMVPRALRREGDTWGGQVTTKEPGSHLVIYGSPNSQGSLQGLFKFEIA